MPFAAVPPDHLPTRPAVVAFSGYRGMPYGGGLSLSFDVTRRSLDVIPFGVTTYRLRRSTHGAFAPSLTDPTGEFLVEGFSRSIVGTGGHAGRRLPGLEDEVPHDLSTALRPAPV